MEEEKGSIFLCAGKIVIVLQLVKWAETMGICLVNQCLCLVRGRLYDSTLLLRYPFCPSYPVSLGCETLLKDLT